MKNVSAEKHFGYPITIRRLWEGCTDEEGNPYFENKETGEIRCFNGKLNPRPSYQREFVYSDEDQEKVFRTLYRAFPLGTMYWCDVGDGNYELIDGQQRVISILHILSGDVSLDLGGDERKYFSDLPESEQDQILDQELLIYVCSGKLNEKLDWFQTINIAGKALKPQELRSAVYSGPFVSSARSYFVNKASANALSNDYGLYVNNSVLRQDLLEQVLYWHADFEGFTGNLDNKVREYLRKHRQDEDAKALFNYYKDVIEWAKYIFGSKYKKELPKVEWGLLYNKYKDVQCTPREVREKVDALMENPEITKKVAIFEYVFSGDEKILQPRAFDDADKRSKFEEQNHKCAYCGNEIPDLKSAHADHIKAWSKGGKTEPSNLQILCVKCNCQKKQEDEAFASSEYSISKQ